MGQQSERRKIEKNIVFATLLHLYTCFYMFLPENNVRPKTAVKTKFIGFSDH